MSQHTESDCSSFRDHLVVPNRREDIDRFEKGFAEAISGMAYDKASCFAVRLAVEECLENAFFHGNGEQPQKTITIDYSVDERVVTIEILDEGKGFDPEAVPDPTREENIDIPSGRGLLLMRAYMTEVRIEPPGNRVRMVFEKSGDS